MNIIFAAAELPTTVSGTCPRKFLDGLSEAERQKYEKAMALVVENADEARMKLSEKEE